ncbi:MAG: histidine kinase N-terminal 7TM domain-containing protein [Candidatus Methanofastidiosia archaeon]
MYCYSVGENKAYTLFCLSIVVFLTGKLIRVSTFDPTIDYFGMKVRDLGGFFLPSTFLYFTMLFPRKPPLFKSLMLIFLFFPSFALLPTLFLQEAEIYDEYQGFIYDSEYYILEAIYIFFFISYCLLGLFKLYASYRKEKDIIIKNQAKLLLFGFSIPIIAGIFFDIKALYFMNIEGINMIFKYFPPASGSLFLLFLGLVTGYAMLRYRLMTLPIENTLEEIDFLNLHLKVVSNSTRLEVINVLIENRKMRFSELRKKLDVRKNLLGYHLSVLKEKSIIGQKQDKSYYLTEKGKKFVEILGVLLQEELSKMKETR